MASTCRERTHLTGGEHYLPHFSSTLKLLLLLPPFPVAQALMGLMLAPDARWCLRGQAGCRETCGERGTILRAPVPLLSVVAGEAPASVPAPLKDGRLSAGDRAFRPLSPYLGCVVLGPGHSA